MKVTCTTGLEEKDARRIEKLAQADMSTPALMLRKAILLGLPKLEADVLGEEFIGGVNRKKKEVLA